ncbi:DUF995 domain-containing protein [Leisingera aquaemixtae]|uniref:DUF995 domain-containing protein n=1 Tax=Leisingera aquaemixtae TaxID=1396826 RepID=A0A0P1HNT8_9RHOB|nr:DUF995 domain-containing protein [Leisingera aquaemixtae]CUH99990.1 hypothetical protein PHA8399_02116 [Leisingera aquaemixtae]
MKLAAKLAATVLLGALPSLVLADPKPRSAKPASPQRIAGIYAGKTDIWAEGCGGGIYYAPNQQARAWCGENSESLGAGEWTIDPQGRVCHQLSWYWPNGDQAGKSLGEQTCISHVVDRWGTVWRSWPNDPEWWPLAGKNSGIKKYSGMKKGYKFQSNVLGARSKLGL